MTMHVKSAALRGVMAVRAETAPSQVQINAAIEAVNRAFEEFKAANDARLKEIEKRGSADAVTSEKVERINADLGSIQKSIDEMNVRIAAGSVGSGQIADPAQRSYAEAMVNYFRKGVDANLRELGVKARLTTQSDPDSGYMVAPQMEAAIDRILGTVSAMRRLAGSVTISSNAYKKPVNVGGATSGWVGEDESRAETSTPSLRMLEFPVHEIYAYPFATQISLEDPSFNAEGWLAQEVATEFAEEEGASFISGTGVKKPKGLLAHDTVLNSSYTWGKIGYVKTGAAANFHATTPGDNLIDLVYALKAGYRSNARFLMSDVVVGRVRKFKDGQSNYLWQPSAQAGQPATYAGYAIETDDNMPDIGANEFVAAFGDFSRAYLIVDRVGVSVLRNPYASVGNVGFYTRKRLGGGVQNFEAVKLLKCEA